MLFEDCICFQLGRLSRGISKTYGDKIGPYGLTQGQFFMLVAILEEDYMLPSRIAEKVALERATTTGLLDRLERNGWIERRHDKTDRRTVRVYPTAKAIDHKDEIMSTFEKTNQCYLSRFSATELKDLRKLLKKLED